MDFLHDDFKSAVLIIFRKLKKNMYKDIRENRKTMSQQIENINREIAIVRRKKEILELKSTKSKTKISQEELKNKEEEKRIN